MKTVAEMAREAGGGLSCVAQPLEHPWMFSQIELERFVELVRADEREACAKFFDDNDTSVFWGSQAAQRIRARENT